MNSPPPSSSVPSTCASVTRSSPTPWSDPSSTTTQLAVVERYVAEGRDAGAHLLTGGDRLEHRPQRPVLPPDRLHRRHGPRCPSPRDEIFGPVLSVLPYDTPRGGHPHRELHLLRTVRRDLEQRHQRSPHRRPRTCAPARSGSTAGWTATPRCRSAATAKAASAANSAARHLAEFSETQDHPAPGRAPRHTRWVDAPDAPRP